MWTCATVVLVAVVRLGLDEGPGSKIGDATYAAFLAKIGEAIRE